MNTLLIDKDAFIDWYFDYEMKQIFFNTYQVAKSLREDGEFSISLDDILQNCGYISKEVAVDVDNVVQDQYGDIDLSHYQVIKFA